MLFRAPQRRECVCSIRLQQRQYATRALDLNLVKRRGFFPATDAQQPQIEMKQRVLTKFLRLFPRGFFGGKIDRIPIGMLPEIAPRAVRKRRELLRQDDAEIAQNTIRKQQLHRVVVGNSQRIDFPKLRKRTHFRDQTFFRLGLHKHQKIEIGRVVKPLTLGIGAKRRNGEHADLFRVVCRNRFHALK